MLIERDQPLFISSPFKEKKLSYNERGKEGKEKKEESYDMWRNTTSVAGAGFDKWQRNCGGEVRTCPHLEQLGRGSTPLSRMQIVCQEDRKNPGAHTVIQGIFSVNFHTEGGPPARGPDRSIKFQRRNGNTWTYFTLLKSCLIRRKSGWENRFPCFRLIETLSGRRSFIAFENCFVDFCVSGAGILFFFLFFWKRERKGKRRNLNEEAEGYFFEVFLTW